MRRIEAKDLDALNLVLNMNPDLAKILVPAVDSVAQIMGLTIQGTGATVGQALAPSHAQKPADQTSQTADLEAKITAWFQAHSGKHALSTVRTDLGVAATSKPFKNAIGNLIGAKIVKFNEKRGKGAEYWLA